MSRDRYSLRLKCPDCNKTGEAKIVDNDDWTFLNRGSEPRVESVSQRFALIENVKKMTFRCECGTVAETSLF